MPIYKSDEITTLFDETPARVVSLVPSTTETLYAFGLGDRLVGVTDFCPANGDESTNLIRLGGTKTPDVGRIIDLDPDLIIANQEENSQDVVQILDDAGLILWLAFPKSTNEAIEDLWTVARIFNQERRLATRIDTLERSLEWTRLAFLDHPRIHYFCPIWKGSAPDWWMTFNRDTYAHDILACCGGENVFSTRERRYPLEADLGLQSALEAPDLDTRYPRVTASEIVATQPDIILLPSEPYSFNKEDVDQLKDMLSGTPAISTNNIHLIDGRLITWHGIRIAEAISSLPRFFQKSDAVKRLTP